MEEKLAQVTSWRKPGISPMWLELCKCSLGKSQERQEAFTNDEHLILNVAQHEDVNYRQEGHPFFLSCQASYLNLQLQW